MIKPREDYVLAKVVDKKEKSAIYSPDDNKIVSDTKEVRVVKVASNIKDIKKGDGIILHATASPMEIKGEKDTFIIHQAEIVATR